MIDERDRENMIERVPAAPDRLFVIRSYAVQPGSESTFESRWRAFAAGQVGQRGCLFQRLHRDVEKTGHYVTYDLWQSQSALIEAIRNTAETPNYPIAGSVRQTFVRLISEVAGQRRDTTRAKAGQAASVRHFYTKVMQEPIFERLWTQSAQNESGHLFKCLHRDLNYPQHYVSYSLWPSVEASDQASSQHPHWQAEHEPYPLVSPVIKEMLVVVGQV